MQSPIGESFQQGTKYHRGKLAGSSLVRANKPDTYRRYRDVPLVELDPPRMDGGKPLWTTLARRQSVRAYRGGQVTKAQLSQLLWASQGITRQRAHFAFRTAPSAGGLYPIETYIAVHAVRDVPAGIYHYPVEEHVLEQVRLGDFRLPTSRAALDQHIAYEADLVFIWTAIFGRSTWKYKQRAYRYIYLDAGHIAQNVALAAVSLGLGSCQIAALYDDEANKLLGVEGQAESVIYMTAVGREDS